MHSGKVYCCHLGESTSKVKEVRDFIMFVTDRFVMDGQTERRKTDAPGQPGTKILVFCVSVNMF